MVAMTTWPDVFIALIAAIPATLAAVFAGLVALRTKMPNGSRIGAMVAETHEMASHNAERIDAVATATGAAAETVQP